MSYEKYNVMCSTFIASASLTKSLNNDKMETFYNIFNRNRLEQRFIEYTVIYVIRWSYLTLLSIYSFITNQETNKNYCFRLNIKHLFGFYLHTKSSLNYMWWQVL
jgi:hypothetical protein